MASFKRVRVLVLAFTTGLSVTACMHAPERVDTLLRQQALQRWEACLKRFDSNLEHYCDGHRRDVLATYPTSEKQRVNSVLLQETRMGDKSRAIKKVFGLVPEDR
ncbi:MAG: hypothetical protein AB8B63_07995 [Granulosicoccus sp.]